MILCRVLETYDAEVAESIKQSEAVRKSAPTKFQENEVQEILEDFGYKGKIPEFNTYAELDAFRRNEIKRLLNRRWWNE